MIISLFLFLKNTMKEGGKKDRREGEREGDRLIQSILIWLLTNLQSIVSMFGIAARIHTQILPHWNVSLLKRQASEFKLILMRVTQTRSVNGTNLGWQWLLHSSRCHKKSWVQIPFCDGPLLSSPFSQKSYGDPFLLVIWKLPKLRCLTWG